MSNYTIVLFPKIQVDTAISYFLLKRFGEEKFPGISSAKVEFWTELPAGKNSFDLEQEGYILIDLGNGRFDHHKLGLDNKTISAAHLVAQYLGIDEKQELVKLLELARRDDLEGRGTISKDAIDRAFGISGLIMSLVKTYTDKPEFVLNTIMPLIEAHFIQEYRRYEELPKEYSAALEAGTAKVFNAIQLGKKLMVVYIETDNTALPSFLRSKDVGAHIVVQKASTGHVNIITKQAEGLELHILSKTLKLLEAQKNDFVLLIDDMRELEKPGRTDGLPHWYYDARANTLQNGGINAKGIPPTKISYEELEVIMKQSLNISKDQSYKGKEDYIPRRYMKNEDVSRGGGDRRGRPDSRGQGSRDRFPRGRFKRDDRPSGRYGRSPSNRSGLEPGERRIKGAIVID